MLNNIIEVSDLTFKYKNCNKPSINHISFKIKRGEWVSIIGKNGSGKSTLINLLDGILEPQDGQIIIDNDEMTKDNVNDIRKKIGIVFQHPSNQFVASTVEDDIAFGLENRQIEFNHMHSLVKDVLTEVDMLKYAQHDPTKLSGGQQQRIALAGVIVMQPDIIILDEATSMLDPKAKILVNNIIREMYHNHDLTVISITHDINEIQNSNRCLLLQDGNLIKDTTPDRLFVSLEDRISLYGLALPFSEQLRLELKNHGFSVPNTYMNDEEIVKWITQYYSKM
jgi:energy-coupling factor transport system ATP-binding protein